MPLRFPLSTCSFSSSGVRFVQATGARDICPSCQGWRRVKHAHVLDLIRPQALSLQKSFVLLDAIS
eukprot:9876227-Karenia_brevis.AAC.1